VAAELRELGVQVRVEPVGLDHPGLEVVDDERAGHAAEMLEGVLQATDEVFDRLREGRLAVAASRVRQDDSDGVGLPALPVGADDRCTCAKVDLRFEPRRALHPPERHGGRGTVLVQEPPHAVVADRGGRRMLGQEVLMDPRGR